MAKGALLGLALAAVAMSSVSATAAAPGGALADAKTVAIDWQVDYGTDKQPKTRFDSLVKRLLKFAGRKVAKRGKPADATLTLKLAMKPVSYPYKMRRCPIGPGKCREKSTMLYTGAKGAGTLTLRATSGAGLKPVAWKNEIRPINVPMYGKMPGKKPHLAPFRELLGLHDIYVYNGVVKALMQMFHDAWGPQLLSKCLGHKSPGVRRAAVNIIGSMRAPQAEPFRKALKKVAKKDRNEHVRDDARRQVKRRGW